MRYFFLAYAIIALLVVGIFGIREFTNIKTVVVA